MIPTLESLCEASLITTLDRHFAQSMGRLAGESDPVALAVAALASRESNEGHTCLALGEIEAREEWKSLSSDFDVPDTSSWQRAATASRLVGIVDIDSPDIGLGSEDPADTRPLVLDASNRLYLRRFWIFQQQLAASIRARASGSVDEIDEACLVDGLNRMFGPLDSGPGDAANPDGPQLAMSFDSPTLDRQRLAATVAVTRKFSVISGGPGTGKTATAVKILALLVEQTLASSTEGQEPSTALPRIAMVAPTGKAAATLSSSIKNAIDDLPCSDVVKAAIPQSALTIHRCLGVRGGAVPRFRHNADHPLAIDILLVDEASMVDLALMTRLLSAVPDDARVILLGDEYQLASVEAGSVLGDICSAATGRGYSPASGKRLRRWVGAGVEVAASDRDSSEIDDSLVRLTHSYRYDPGSGIGALARAINEGDATRALEILEAAESPEVMRVDFSAHRKAEGTFAARMVEGFHGYLAQEDPAGMLRDFGQFRVLAPQRVGPGGVVQLNREIEAYLRGADLLRDQSDRYPGRPLMVKSNDYGQALWNGDVGIVLPGEPGLERVVFDAEQGGAEGTRRLAYSRLPECETAFAMTIHKSQGSEFERVAVVLTDAAAERATRELLYTAVTRARTGVTLFASANAIAQAIGRQIPRSSGLGDALRSPNRQGEESHPPDQESI